MKHPWASLLVGLGVGVLVEFAPDYEWVKPLGRTIGAALVVWGLVLAYFKTDWPPIVKLRRSIGKVRLRTPWYLTSDTAITIGPLTEKAIGSFPAKIDASIQPLPQLPRQLTNFEIETKLKAVDLWIDFLVAESELTTTEGRWILAHYDNAFRDQDWRAKLVARAEEFRERARKLGKTAEAMTHANLHHADVLHLVHGNGYSAVASATDNFVRSLLDLTLNMDAPREIYMRFMGPSALQLEQSLDALTRWRNQAHTSLVHMRRNFAP